MPKHEFGGDWTKEKLERVRKYLAAYTTIFSKNPKAQKLTTIYVDAFAGTGYRSDPRQKHYENSLFPDPVEPDAKSFLTGSAHIALEVEPPFKRFLFIEMNAERAQDLENLKAQFPDKATNIRVVVAEANDYLKRWCAQVDWRYSRAVVFLDPYGMQVEWSLIEAIAATRAIDLWILFPLGVAINRLLTKGEPPPAEWAMALTRILGNDEWKDVFYQRKINQTLFGDEEVQIKDTDFDRIGEFFVKRLKTIFTSVAENPLPLRNSRNVPLYLLCFAAGNPKGAPTAIKIAQHILRR
jgi:three-Cys-motif partner protein